MRKQCWKLMKHHPDALTQPVGVLREHPGDTREQSTHRRQVLKTVQHQQQGDFPEGGPDGPMTVVVLPASDLDVRTPRKT